MATQLLDDANNPRRDFGHVHAARVARGEEDLGGLVAGHKI